VKVAPFKAQNMSNNSAVTPDGGEIGRAQAMQAAAARVEPETAMNPVLLKPGGDRVSHVVVLGRPAGEVDALGYRERKPALLRVALDALADLRSRFDVVVCEGAGSPAEINLRATDIANMGLARAAGLPVVVVGDIDRGGVFAALFGTVALLDPADQALVAGFVVNKFRGDRRLLDPGLAQLSALTGRPTYGVLPYVEGLWGDVEDSLALDAPPVAGAPPAGDDLLRVAVVRLPRISNFTDVDALRAEPGVVVRFVTSPAELADADLAVLPGTRATVADLAWLRGRGLDAVLAARAADGRPVLGICGGYQMFGGVIVDEVEGAGPPDRHRAGLDGARLRDPPRRGDRRRFRGTVPGRRPGRVGVRDDVARGAGERRLPPGVLGRGGCGDGPALGAGHGAVRDRARGPARPARRPGRRAPRHRRAAAAHRVGRAGGPAVRASGGAVTAPTSAAHAGWLCSA
jgi:adenosylcobyric acid synthase